MSPRIVDSNRTSLLKKIVAVAMFVLGLKVVGAMLLEYPRYFPADFEATFLIGREKSFTPLYATAFYVHIVTGPVAVLLATFLVWSGGRRRWLAWHRWAARGLMALIFVALTPSGLIMAPKAFAGPVAGVGFAALALLTALTAGQTLYYARQRKLELHARWAGRCYVLLVSPLILRVVAGLLIVLQADTELAYRLNAWLSWLVPLALYEVWWRYSTKGANKTLTQHGAPQIAPRLD